MGSRIRKLSSPLSRLSAVILYILLITLFDVYSYGVIYQEKIQKENYHHPVWSWMFEESGKETEMEHVTVPRYRVLQKMMEIGGVLLVFYLCGLWPAIGLVISHYLLTYDMLFYLVLNPGFIKVMESSINPYWLQNWYQIGYFALNPFNSTVFYVSGFTGLFICVILSFLPSRRPVR